MKRKNWLNVGFAVTMLASMALVGCGGSNTASTQDSSTGSNAAKPDAVQEINLPLSDEVPTLDVSKATDNLAFAVLSQLDEGLVRIDAKGNPTAGIAKTWDISPDGLHYTFHLRDDAKWTNGDPVTAHDFEYSWKRTLDPKTESQYAFMVAWVKGGDAYSSNKGTADQVAVKATDDHTLDVTLAHPVPFFLSQLSFPIFFAQNQKFVEAAGDKNGSDFDKVVSDGPFKLTDWQHEQSMTAVKNDAYYNKDQVILQKINWQVVKDTNSAVNLYQSGQLDRSLNLVASQVDTYKSSPDFMTVPELTNGYIDFNTTEKVFSSPKVRQALTYAIDGNAFADVVYHNGTTGATGLVPTGTSDGQGGDFRKDQGDLIDRKDNAPKAKDLLKQGLQEEGLTSFPTNVKLTIDDGDVGKKAAEFLKEQWRQNLGIDVQIESVPFKLRLQKESHHQYDLGWALWGADYDDPMTFLDMYTSDSPFNDPQWKNADYDKLIHAAQQEPDAKKRMSELQDAEKLLLQQMPVGPVFFRATAVLLKPYVKDFVVTLQGPPYDLIHTYIQGKK